MTDIPARQLAEWTGRVLLLGAVALWWGAVVVPQLVSLTFPELLPPDAIPWNLDPNNEGAVANTVSAGALLTVGALAFVNALQLFARIRSRDVGRGKAVRLFDRLVSQDWIAAGGWSALAITATLLGWEEIAEFKSAGLPLGKMVLGEGYHETFWPVFASPLIIAFVLAMGVFVGKGLSSTRSGRQVRGLLVLGLTAWVLALVYEVSGEFAFGDYRAISRLLEETLEFGGSLVIGLSAAIASRTPDVPRPVLEAHGRQAPNAGRKFRGRDRVGPKVWSLAVVVAVAGIAGLGIVTPAFREAPLADARAYSSSGAFQVNLDDEISLVQELGTLPAFPVRIDLRVINRDPQGRPGTMIWRVIEAGEDSGRIFREGRLEVPAGEHPGWETLEISPLAEAEGRPLALQLIAEVEPNAHLRVGATKTNRYQDGRLWVNGELTWPDQNIEFVAYTGTELTRGKLRAMLGVLTSHWRWPVMVLEVAIAMTLITLIPVLLVTAALPGRRSRQLRH
ncbi:MAG: hypothetical protein OXG46_02780 [Chloroflexi bacterium]|nr:hypothetical protein [Chloroflexota bacterium]MCY3938961.1 hypothetical protein [Chloroflexota bacterium]